MVAGCAPGVRTIASRIRFHCTTGLTGRAVETNACSGAALTPAVRIAPQAASASKNRLHPHLLCERLVVVIGNGLRRTVDCVCRSHAGRPRAPEIFLGRSREYFARGSGPYDNRSRCRHRGRLRSQREFTNAFMESRARRRIVWCRCVWMQPQRGTRVTRGTITRGAVSDHDLRGGDERPVLVLPEP